MSLSCLGTCSVARPICSGLQLAVPHQVDMSSFQNWLSCVHACVCGNDDADNIASQPLVTYPIVGGHSGLSGKSD
jgi:hypothetical protein